MNKTDLFIKRFNEFWLPKTKLTSVDEDAVRRFDSFVGERALSALFESEMNDSALSDPRCQIALCAWGHQDAEPFHNQQGIKQGQGYVHIWGVDGASVEIALQLPRWDVETFYGRYALGNGVLCDKAYS